MGKWQVLDVKIWVCFLILKFAVDKGTSEILIQMDSAIAAQLVAMDNNVSCYLATIIGYCRLFIQSFTFCDLKHIVWENKITADRLANWSHGLDLEIIFWNPLFM